MPHQKRAVEQLDNGKVLYGGVGSGKTVTALAYYVKKESPKDIYVITIAKKRDGLDWQKEALHFRIGKKPDETLHGILHVDSWHNISSYVDVEDAFFIFDEQKVVGSGAWVKAFLKITKNNNWILLSATPGDTWLDYIPLFVANGLYRNAFQFKQEHVVYAPFVKFPKVVRYTGTDTLERYRNMLLVEMPYYKHTNRIVEEIHVDYDVELYREAHIKRKHVYENRPIRNISELFVVLRKIVGTDPSRREALLALTKKHQKLVVFYNFDYELDILRGLNDHVPTAEWNGHRKDPIPETDRWIYLVQYNSGAEGWNCTETNAMVFWSLNYSWKIMEQCQGRIDRLDTPFTDLYYYQLVSDSWSDKAVLKALKNKKRFNERDYRSEFADLCQIL